MIWKFPYYQIGEPINWTVLESELDWLSDMRGVPQDPIWHAEGDVLTHTKMVVEALLGLPEFQKLSEQEKHILVAAALLHDVEKRSTTTTEFLDGRERIVSPRHAQRGEYTSRIFLYKGLPTPFEIREQITQLVRFHGFPLWALEKDNVRQKVIEVGLLVNTKHLAILSKADVLGRICNDQNELLYRVSLFEELAKEHKCFGKKYSFKSDYGRFLFLNRDNISPDYEPFDDLKFTVHMLCALPGSGKDTYFKNNFDLPVLSLDDIRRKEGVLPTDKKKNGQVIQLGKEQAKVFMRAKQSFVFNATNITREIRSKWINLFTEYGGRVRIIYLEVPYNTLISQNHNRKYKVPNKVLERMISKLEVPTFREAHEVEFIVKDY